MKSVANLNPRAWLYQFNPVGEATWVQDLESGSRVDWRIVNYVNRTHPGDAVVFWESGADGGLRGWGSVIDAVYLDSSFDTGEKRKRRWRVPVIAEHWQEEPVPRQMLKESEALQGMGFMRMSRGANFLLAPHEYANLLVLMGVAESESLKMAATVSSHPEEDEEGGDELEMGLKSDILLPEWLRPGEITTAAESILRDSGYSYRDIVGPVTSTRLFLAVFDPDKWSSVAQKNPPETAALRALRDVVVRFKVPLLDMRSAYLEVQKESTGKAGFSRNAERLLQKAHESQFTERAGGLLSADGIISALLTIREGSVLKHMQMSGLSLTDLRDQFLRRITEHYELIRPLWRQAFAEEEALPIGFAGRIGRVQLSNDNAWSQGISDSLGSKREADAFAALATSSTFVPPLAVGVFGEWGSGKSFFMRLVYDRIKTLSDSARKHKNDELLSDVVQIRFNAWHYVESNLWASIVDHIFTELDKATSALSSQAADKIFQQLTTARELTISSAEQLMERRSEQAHAAIFVAEAEARFAAKQADAATSPTVYWNTTLALLQEKIIGDVELQRKAKLLGMESAIADVQQLGKSASELDSARAQCNIFFQGMRKELATPGRFTVFLVFSALLWMVIFVGRDQIASMLDLPAVAEKLKGWVLALSSVGIAAASVLGGAAVRVGKALSFMLSVRDKFRKAAEERSKQSESKVKQIQDELARLAAEVAEGKARFAASTEKVGDAAREYNGKNGRGRLLGFLRSRAAGESYAKHLGLVSMVRKDFEELSDLISESLNTDDTREAALVKEQADFRKRVEAVIARADLARKGGTDLLHEQEREQLRDSVTPKEARTDFPTVNRIVLYIDDLDRCQPEKVVEVLQAVHLLLSFRLFIVFVAVDVRWVSRALHETYRSLLGRSAGVGGASAHDYLEKIFQVPYWVRPMGVSGSSKFMADRLSLQKKARQKKVDDGAIKAVDSQPTSAGAAGTISGEAPAVEKVVSPATPVTSMKEGDGATAHAGSSVVSSGAALSSSKATYQRAAQEGGTTVAGVSDTQSSAYPSTSSSLRDDVPKVDLTEAEVEFMTALACFGGNSPRRLIRFLNIYQLMKATLSADDDFGAENGDFYELMTQVAIVTGAPDLLEAWHGILQASKDSIQVGELRNEIAKLAWDGEPLKCLDGALETLQKRRSWADAAGLRIYSELSRRFSFGSAFEQDELPSDYPRFRESNG